MLSLRRAQLDQLNALAEVAFPREACALLIGREHGDGLLAVAEVVAADNVAADGEREFELDPAVHIAVLRRLRESNAVERVIGHWHSHPNGRAEPSAMDAAMVHDPGLVWAITSLLDGRVQELRAFRPALRNGFDAIPVEILP
ncbi:MAG TPA: M67 family metallopeptidase [Ferrovibrio sp.]|uniref:M67 family metallopeptidase n=1 Tax=Ferrovibrio sp. TaxID=1917215 RepID=UPI002ED476F4